MIFLDTNAAIWLYAGHIGIFSKKARALIDAEELVISPIVVLELGYLRESGRFRDKPEQLSEALAGQINLKVDDASVLTLIQEALNETWTRDSFDRLIVSHAKLRRAPLLTKDRHILDHYKKAVWD